MKAAFLSLFIIFLLASCTKKPDLNGFDVAVFKNDRGACQGDRRQQLAWLKANK